MLKTSVPVRRRSLCAKFKDTSGASIVIALVFFLICAIIGSIVVTAASVQAKAVVTQAELAQQEFTVTSAAELVGEDLASAKATAVTYSNGKITGVSVTGQTFADAFWSTHGFDIMEAYLGSNPLSFTDLTVNARGQSHQFDEVQGTVTVDNDLNITVLLSLAPAPANPSPYDMRVFVQCIPTFNVKGQLVSFEYERPVIEKAVGA